MLNEARKKEESTVNDPHVVALIYRVYQDENSTVDYSKAMPLVGLEEPTFQLAVQDQKARFEFKVHYATVGEAREAIEDYIRVWEFHANLELGAPGFQLKFDRPEIVDRNQTPSMPMLHAQPAKAQAPASQPRLLLAPTAYPSPPSRISLNPDVQTMYQRYMGYRRGNEPLASMAYFCLTVLEYSAGKKRRAAAKKYQIGLRVLGRIGMLSEKKGGFEARKAAGVVTELTKAERRFLEEAVRTMIRRAAEKAYDPHMNMPVISLSDLL